MDELLNNSLSTTNSDRNLKLNLYMQNQLRRYINTMEGVEESQVFYIPVDESNSILSTQRETSASVLLTVNKDFKKDTAQTIAEVVASVIGNNTTDTIKVADQNGNLLLVVPRIYILEVLHLKKNIVICFAIPLLIIYIWV